MRILLFVLVAACASAAPLERDLGEGLVYFRVRQLPDDLPAAGDQSGHPCVLDVRYVTGDAATAAALSGWIKRRSSLHTPVLLLANRETSKALLGGFGSADAVPGLVIIAPDTAPFPSDISVAVSPRRERRAYDALAAGTPPSALIDDNPEKPRNDEARLAREHISDSEMIAEEDSAARSDAPAAPRKLIDPELQRAVQLDRALLALRRLQP